MSTPPCAVLSNVTCLRHEMHLMLIDRHLYSYMCVMHINFKLSVPSQVAMELIPQASSSHPINTN